MIRREFKVPTGTRRSSAFMNNAGHYIKVRMPVKDRVWAISSGSYFVSADFSIHGLDYVIGWRYLYHINQSCSLLK